MLAQLDPNSPTRLPALTRIILSTRNSHKAREIRDLLPNHFEILTLRDFPNAPAVTEDAGSFAGNSAKKALELASWLESPGGSPGAEAPSRAGEFYVLADDSGLEVDALQGAPGVHSARFAAIDTGQSGNSTDAENNAKLLRLLQNIPTEERTARFRCVIALVRVPAIEPANRSTAAMTNGTGRPVELYDGACEGRIAFVPSGAGGFGYDPLFVPEGFATTFADLGDDVKNGISHRARALAKLRTRFRE